MHVYLLIYVRIGAICQVEKGFRATAEEIVRRLNPNIDLLLHVIVRRSSGPQRTCCPIQIIDEISREPKY